MNKSTSVTTYALVIFFAVLYAGISILNHLHFRSNALDLAYYNQAIFDFSEFRMGSYTLWPGAFPHIFADHFEPVLILIAPLRYLLGSYTLLWIQIAAILAGGLGLRKYLLALGADPWVAVLGMVHFYSLWGIFSALAFDFHTVVPGVMCVPWMLWALERRKWLALSMLSLLMVAWTEKMAYMGIFLGLTALVLYRRDAAQRLAAGALSLGCVGYFLLVSTCIIPAFQAEGERYRHFDYPVLGNSAGEAIQTVVDRPVEIASYLFVSHKPEAKTERSSKQEFWIMFLLAGGLFCLWRPAWLITLIPLIATKMLANKTGAWGINKHYSIEFVPILSLMAYSALAQFRAGKMLRTGAAFIASLALLSTFISFSMRAPHHMVAATQNPLLPMHWEPWLDEDAAWEAIESIPEDAVVAAASPFGPHLAMRDSLLLLPQMVPGTEYILALKHGNRWPMNDAQVAEFLAKHKKEVWWETMHESEDIILLRNRVVARKKGRLPPLGEARAMRKALF